MKLKNIVSLFLVIFIMLGTLLSLTSCCVGNLTDILNRFESDKNSDENFDMESTTSGKNNVLEESESNTIGNQDINEPSIIEIRETGSIYWNVTRTSIQVYSKDMNGNKIYDREIPDDLIYYESNAIGERVLCKHTPIKNIVDRDTNGVTVYEYVWVYKDQIVVTDTSDENYSDANILRTYVRYEYM